MWKKKNYISTIVCTGVSLSVYTVNTHLRNVFHLLSSPYCLWIVESAVDPGRGRLETVIDQLVASLQRTSLDTLGLSLNDPATKHRGKKGDAHRRSTLFTPYLQSDCVTSIFFILDSLRNC